MFYLQIILSATILGGVCFAGCLTHSLRLTRRQAIELDEALEAAEMTIKTLEDRVTTLAERQHAALKQIDGLLIRQARLEKGAQKREYVDAIDLSRQGADARELETTCGLSIGEARLIKTLYGAGDDARSST